MGADRARGAGPCWAGDGAACACVRRGYLRLTLTSRLKLSSRLLGASEARASSFLASAAFPHGATIMGLIDA